MTSGRLRLDRYVLLGELGLGGALRPVREALPVAIATHDAATAHPTAFRKPSGCPSGDPGNRFGDDSGRV